MTAGLLLVACVGVPAVAALVVAAVGAGSRLEPIVSNAAGVITLAVAVVVAALVVSSATPYLQTQLPLSGWKITPDEPIPTFTLHLGRPWAFAPALAAACALLLVRNSELGRNWHVHLQHAAVQGSLSAATPEFGLAMVTTSTVGLAMCFSTSEDAAQRRGLATAMRWASADTVLWLWTAGYTGAGTGISRVAAVALLVRASAFPFQGGLARMARDTNDSSLSLVPFPAAIWALRWMDPSTISNTFTWQLAIAAAVLVPSLLAFSSGNNNPGKGYQLSSLIIWPIAFPMPLQWALGLIGLGIAASLSRSRSVWHVIARAATIIVPTLLILSAAEVKELTAAEIGGWMVVSLSAILMFSVNTRRAWTLDDELECYWREATLVILALTAFIWPMSAGVPSTADP